MCVGPSARCGSLIPKTERSPRNTRKDTKTTNVRLSKPGRFSHQAQAPTRFSIACFADSPPGVQVDEFFLNPLYRC